MNRTAFPSIRDPQSSRNVAMPMILRHFLPLHSQLTAEAVQ